MSGWPALRATPSGRHRCSPVRGLYAAAGTALTCGTCQAVWVARRGPTTAGWRRPVVVAYGWFALGAASTGWLDMIHAPLGAYLVQMLGALLGISATVEWVNRPPAHVLTTQWRRRRWHHRLRRRGRAPDR